MLPISSIFLYETQATASDTVVRRKSHHRGQFPLCGVSVDYDFMADPSVFLSVSEGSL